MIDTKQDKNKRRPVIFLAILSLGIGFFFLALSPDFPVGGDTITEYHPIAKNLAEGVGFWNNGEPTARVAPGYPFVLSLVYRTGGGFEAVRILQIFALTGIVLLSYLIARNFLSRPLAFLSALSVAFWPYLLLYTNLILTETIFIFFLVLAIYAILELSKFPASKNAIFAGGALGLATLIRPVTLLLPFWLIGIIVFFALLLRRKQIFSHWKTLALATAVFIIVISPWTIRNAIQFQEFIPVATGLGTSIGRGYQTLDYAEGSQALKPGEVTITDNIIARLTNVYLFWNPGAQGANAALLTQQNQLFGIAFLGYKVLFIITTVLAFLAFFLKKNRELLILGAVVLYFWAVHTILYPFPRYTLPIMPLVIILAWISLSSLWQAVNYATIKKLYGKK